MGIKINQYPLERLTFGDEDFYDIDYWDGATYQTAKIKGSAIKAGIESGILTIYENDGTLSGARTVNMNNFSLGFTGGSVGIEHDLTVFSNDPTKQWVATFIASSTNAVLAVQNTHENVGVGTSAPATCSKLEVDSTDKGILIPRMTTTQRNAISGIEESLMIYNIDTNQFEFVDSSLNWVALGGGDSIYTADGTVGSGRIATLTDTFAFYQNGTTNEVFKVHTNGEVTVSNGGTERSKFFTNGDVALGSNTIIGVQAGICLHRNVLVKSEANTSSNTAFQVVNTSNSAFFKIQGNGATIINGNSLISSEDISLQGETVIKGNDTLNTSTALAIYDGDTTPNKLWDFTNDGNVNLGQSTKFLSIQQEIACFQSSGLNPYITINATNGTNRSSVLFQRQGVDKWLFGNDGVNDSFRIRNLSTGDNPIVLGNGNNTIDITYDLDMNSNRITNAVINPSVQETASTASFTIDADSETMGILTGMTQNVNVEAPTGTPVQGQKLMLRFKDDGTSRNFTWNVIWRAIGVTLPTATTANKTLYVGAVYNSTDSKWDVIAVKEEA